MFTNVFFYFCGNVFFHLCCQRRGSLLVCIVQTTFTYREGNGTQHNLKINTSVNEHWTVNSREKKKPTDRKTDKPNQHSCSTQSTSLTALTDKLRLKVCHVMRQTKEQVVKVIWQQAASPPHMDGSMASARWRHVIHVIVPWSHQSLKPKRHLDRFSRFCRAHYCDRPTDRPRYSGLKQ